MNRRIDVRTSPHFVAEFGELARCCGLLSPADQAEWGRHRAIRLADYQRRCAPTDTSILAARLSAAAALVAAFQERGRIHSASCEVAA